MSITVNENDILVKAQNSALANITEVQSLLRIVQQSDMTLSKITNLASYDAFVLIDRLVETLSNLDIKLRELFDYQAIIDSISAKKYA